MTKPFVPHRPEKEVFCKITKRESVLLHKMRKHHFGKFIVYKADGLIVRAEINESQLIGEEDNSLEEFRY